MSAFATMFRSVALSELASSRIMTRARCCHAKGAHLALERRYEEAFASKDALLATKEELFASKNAQLAAKDTELAVKDVLLASKDQLCWL